MLLPSLQGCAETSSSHCISGKLRITNCATLFRACPSIGRRARSILNKNYRTAVRLKCRVRGEQRQPFGMCLRNENAVKRIAVYVEQKPHGQHVGAAYIELAIAITEQAGSQCSWIHVEITATKGVFNRHFPNAGNAKPKLVVLGQDDLPCPFRKSPIGERSPKQQVCVKEVVQRLPTFPSNASAISSCSMVSKSSGMRPVPFINPMRFGFT